MKKITSLLLSLLLVFLIGTAVAEDQTVERGATLTMDVNLTSGSGLYAKIGLKTNDAPVTFESATGGKVNDTVPPKSFDGYFVVVNMKGLELKSDGSGFSGGVDKSFTVEGLQSGVIGSLSFTVKSDAPAGEYTVEAYNAADKQVVSSLTFVVKDDEPDVPDVPDVPGTRKPGDVNADTFVDIGDSMFLDMYLAGWDIEINMSNADVNADTFVDIGDSMFLDMYLAGWDITLE